MGFRVRGSRFEVRYLGFGVPDLGSGCGIFGDWVVFGVWGLRFRVWGLGYEYSIYNLGLLFSFDDLEYRV